MFFKSSFVLFALCASVFAEKLSFETKLKAVDVDPHGHKIEVLFPFKNTSEEAVKIIKYDAPCSCMSAQIKGGEMDAKSGVITFAPGSEGVVKAIFELGNYIGTLDKKVVLWLDNDGKKAPKVTLVTRLQIPVLIGARPQSLVWASGAPLTKKVINVKVDSDEPINILTHKSSNPQVEYEFKTIKEGFEYQLIVTPKSTEKPLFAAIRMTTDSKNARYKSVQTFMTVKPPKKAK